MADLRQQRDAARTERDQLRAQVRDLQLILGDIAPEYANAYATICDIAIHGLRRPDDLGQPINSNHAESRAPQYHARAYHIRNEERRWQRERAATLNRMIDSLDGTTQHPPVVPAKSPNPSQMTTPYATLRFSVQRAPQ